MVELVRVKAEEALRAKRLPEILPGRELKLRSGGLCGVPSRAAIGLRRTPLVFQLLVVSQPKYAAVEEELARNELAQPHRGGEAVLHGRELARRCEQLLGSITHMHGHRHEPER